MYKICRGQACCEPVGIWIQWKQPDTHPCHPPPPLPPPPTHTQVHERLPEPPSPHDLSVWGDFEQASERLYMIGLNGRGQAVLRSLGAMDTIDSASSIVSGRLDWQPGADSPKLTRYTTRTYKTRCIQRDRLAACLLQVRGCHWCD